MRSRVDLLSNVHDGRLPSVLFCSFTGKLSGFHPLDRNCVASLELGQGRAHRRIPVGPRGKADNKVRRSTLLPVSVTNIPVLES